MISRIRDSIATRPGPGRRPRPGFISKFEPAHAEWCVQYTQKTMFLGKIDFSPTGEAAVVSGVFGGVVGKIEVVLVSKTNFVLRLGWVRGFGCQI